jgi:hypothetical protein
MSEVTFTISDVDTGWVEFVSLEYGDLNIASGLDESQLTYTHAYITGGSFDAVLTISGAGQTGSCTANVVVTGSYAFVKTAELNGSTISYTIQGTAPNSTVEVTDTLSGGTMLGGITVSGDVTVTTSSVSST